MQKKLLNNGQYLEQSYATQGVNDIFNRMETLVTPSMIIGVPVYVDDIYLVYCIGDRLTVEEAGDIGES